MRPNSAPKISLGDNSSVVFSADIGVRHDDNVYLDKTKVGDTITTVTPGVEFRFGQNSLAHGGLNYAMSFNRYAHHTSPNVKLGNGSADFGYDSGTVAIVGSGSFQQLNQNSSGAASPPANQNNPVGLGGAYRRDVSNFGATAESRLTAKTSLSGGATLSQTEYKTSSLIGTRSLSLPLNIYYKATPVIDLSLGFTHTRMKPQNDGPTAQDSYYNVGVRGEITPKLTGNLSAGYRTREVTANPKENTVGFDGSFNYEATAKTNLALILARNFAVGAKGESVTSSSSSLRLTTAPDSQWQFSAGLTYSADDYGAFLFNPQAQAANPAGTTARKDTYWETNLVATYIFNSWLSATFDSTFRNNRSNDPNVEFSNRVFSLSLGLRY